ETDPRPSPLTPLTGSTFDFPAAIGLKNERSTDPTAKRADPFMQDELLARVWVLGFVGPSLEPGSKGAIRMRVVVLGGSFGGITASYELRKALPREHEIVLVSNSSLFVYRPSLPFVALGSRRPEDITAELKPALRRRGIAFQQATVQGIDPLARRVATTAGPID